MPLNVQKAAGQRNHDIRAGAQPAYIDPERRSLNRVLVHPTLSSDLRKKCVDRYALKSARKMRRDAMIGIGGLLTFGREAKRLFERLAQDVQDETFRAAADALAADLGTTVESLVVHLDEGSIHAHFTLAGYALDGHRLSKELTRKRLAGMQDIVASVFGTRCPGIERGTPARELRKETRRDGSWPPFIHRSVRQLHEDLPEDLERKRQEVRDTMDAMDAMLDGRLRLTDDRSWEAEDGTEDLRGRIQELAHDWDDDAWAFFLRIKQAVEAAETLNNLGILLWEDCIRVDENGTWTQGRNATAGEREGWRAFLDDIDLNEPRWLRLQASAQAARRRRKVQAERMAVVVAATMAGQPVAAEVGAWEKGPAWNTTGPDGAGERLLASLREATTDWHRETWDWLCRLSEMVRDGHGDAAARFVRESRALLDQALERDAQASAGAGLETRRLPRTGGPAADG